MWSLGAFMGEIWRAVKQPTETRSGGVTRLETSRHTDEQAARAPDGTPVTLRRTVIEEIEYPADRSPPKDDGPAHDDPKP